MGPSRAAPLLALLCLALMVGCSAPSPAPTTAAPPGAAAGATDPTATLSPALDTNARIRLGLAGLNPTLDPHNQSTPVTTVAQYAVFDTLVTIGERGAIAPEMAESWTLMAPTHWRIRLRPNIRFHNGELMTAATAKWNMERIADPANRLGFISELANLDRAVAVDDLTLDLYTKTPQPNFLSRIRVIGIIPRAYFEQVGFEGFLARPVGTGMFRVVEFTGGNRFVGERFDGYYQKGPNFRTLEIVVLGEAVARLAALRSNQIDMMERVPPSEYEAVKSEGWRTFAALTGSVQGVWFDHTQDTPLRNKDVRLALNYDSDRETAIRTIGGGLGIAVGQPAHPDIFGYNPEIKPYPFDPARARAHMQRAGMTAGFSIRMHVIPQTDPLAGLDMAQFLQNTWLRDLNIRVELDPVDLNRYLQMSSQGGFQPMRLATQGFGSEAAGALQRFRFEGEPNPARRLYRNDEFDRVFNASLAEFDEARREKLVQQASQILYEDAAAVFLTIQSQPWAMIKQIDGLKLNGDGHIVWQNLVRYAGN